MSGAAGQAVRAGIRESAGTGRSRPVNALLNPTAFLPPSLIPQLEPDPGEISKLLKSRKIADKNKKYQLFKLFYGQKAPIASCLNGIRAGASAAFDGLEWGARLKGVSGYSGDFLGGFLFQLWGALEIVLPGTEEHTRLGRLQKSMVSSLDVMYKAALHMASTEAQSKLSSQFVSVSTQEAERKYLQNGYLPTDVADRLCICCGHGYTDEPNTNITDARDNELSRGQWERQVSEDRATQAAGGTVLTNRGQPMAEGRQRPEPSYKNLIRHCHCIGSQCTTSSGPVPVEECPKRCIDDATGERYGFDPASGRCLCPICSCNNCPSYYTVSPAPFLRSLLLQ